MATLFYAWQSDQHPDICRYLIRDAAKAALKKLKADPSVYSAPSFELDQDRQGVAGHPHIASVIRRKIKNCDVFLADLTHVASYDSYDKQGKRTKHAQNPNVLIELGIAIRAKGFERLILVMNAAFGQPEDLPFDLKSHSFPITYHLSDPSDPERVKAARKKLADDIANALKPMLSAIAQEPSKPTGEARHRRVIDLWAKRNGFEDRIRSNGFYRFQFSRGCIALTIFPLIEIVNPLDLKPTRIGSQLQPLGNPSTWTPEYEMASVIASVSDPSSDGKPGKMFTVTELTRDGEVYSADDAMSIAAANIGGVEFRFAAAEQDIFKTVKRYSVLLRSMNVTGPLLVGISVLNIKRIQFTPIEGFTSRRTRLFDRDDIKADFVEIGTEIEVGKTREVAKALRPAFDLIWRACDLPEDPHFTDSGYPNMVFKEDEE